VPQWGRYANPSVRKVLQKWAIQGENTPADRSANPQNSEIGAAKRAASGGSATFGDAVAAIMRLPLSDVEKADAVRRLLAADKGAK